MSLGGSVVGVASLTGGMLALRAVSGMVAGPISGLVSDRLGDRWSVVRGGILLGCGGFVILAFLGGVGAVPLGVAMVSLSAGAMLTALAALVGDHAAGQRQGVMMGALATAGDMGSAVGPPLAYALAVAVDLSWLYLGCALALASGLLATLWGVWDR